MMRRLENHPFWGGYLDGFAESRKTNDWPDAVKVLLVELLLALEVSGGKGIYQ